MCDQKSVLYVCNCFLGAGASKTNPLENIVDLREYDLPLHVRASIDKSVFVGKWYQVKCKGNDEEPEIRYEPRGILN